MFRKNYNFYVYIMASYTCTLYTGVTNNLTRRITEHKEGKIEGFSEKYGCKKLVYYEQHQYIYNAIAREKEIKDWPRKEKQDLIKQMNPRWDDLSQYLVTV
jgi:putative endonuclease